MESTLERFVELRAHIAELNKQKVEMGKEVFTEESKRVFGEHPGLVSFSWTQYTPYFNDGDTCTFSANTEDITLVFSGDRGKYNDDEFSEWSMADKENPMPRDKAGLAALELLKNFDEDTLEEIFGDHTEITVSREGITTEGYNHD